MVQIYLKPEAAARSRAIRRRCCRTPPPARAPMLFSRLLTIMVITIISVTIISVTIIGHHHIGHHHRSHDDGDQRFPHHEVVMRVMRVIR